MIGLTQTGKSGTAVVLLSTVALMCSSQVYSSQAQAATILSTNFDTASGTITSDTANVAGTDGMNVIATADRYVTFADAGGGKAMQFVQNSDNSGSPAAYKSFTGASTTATGDNLITGTFTLRLNHGGSGNNPTFRFFITSGADPLAVGNTLTSAYLSVRGNGSGSYRSGPGGTDTSFSLAVDTTYLVEVTVDLSGTQDLWRLRVSTPEAPTTYVVNSGFINSWAPDTTPSHLVWYAGAGLGNSWDQPFATIDDVSFALTPEPGALAGMAAAGLVLARRRRTRQ